MKDKRYRTKFIQRNENDHLICYKCFEYKLETEFSINKERWFRNNKDYRCNKCRSIQNVKRKEYNRGRKDLDRLLLERWHGLKLRAKKHNLIIDFDWIFLKELWENQNGLCALSKIPMTFIMDNGRIFTNVSVDRIDNNLSYIKENIQLVCMSVNQMKNDLDLPTLHFLCEQILKNK